MQAVAGRGEGSTGQAAEGVSVWRCRCVSGGERARDPGTMDARKLDAGCMHESGESWDATNPANSGVVRKLPESSREVAPAAELWPHLGPKWPKSGPIWPKAGQIRPRLAKLGPHSADSVRKTVVVWPNVGKSRPIVLPSWANVGGEWSMLPKVGQSGSNLAKTWPGPSLANCWSKSSLSLAPGATFRQLSGNFWTTPQLTGPAGGNFPACVACNCSATCPLPFGQLKSLRHNRPLQLWRACPLHSRVQRLVFVLPGVLVSRTFAQASCFCCSVVVAGVPVGRISEKPWIVRMCFEPNPRNNKMKNPGSAVT